MKMEKPIKKGSPTINVRKIIRIGVIGYSAQKFNELTARAYINDTFNLLKEHFGENTDFHVYSGLTNLGIPKLAYENAVDRNWKTVGFAAKCAEEYEWFPCDSHFIVGENWGDESEAFLENIDILVKIGGGNQSQREMEMAKEKGLRVISYDI